MLYAIGDVHGRADLLELLLAFIEDDAKTAGRNLAIMMLGDLVDRGPDSCRVLDMVVALLARWPASRFCLGNHDSFFLSFLDETSDFPDIVDSWLSQGGDATLRSYGLTSGTLPAFRELIFAEHPEHVAALRKASLLEVNGPFAFVHAGVRPDLPLTAQMRDDLLWIRAPFLRHVGPLERIVVHGHSPQKPPRPHVSENRISLDTGAFFSGALSALRYDGLSNSLSFVATDWRGRVSEVDPVRVDRGFGTALDGFS